MKLQIDATADATANAGQNEPMSECSREDMRNTQQVLGGMVKDQCLVVGRCLPSLCRLWPVSSVQVSRHKQAR